jgi:hypothetical protein
VIVKSLAALAIGLVALAGLATDGALAAKLTGAGISKLPLKMQQQPGPPRYVFRIDDFEITKTRALHEDTDYVTAGLSGQANQVKSMGDRNDGTFPVGLSFTAAVDANGKVTLSYVIINTAKPLGAVTDFLRTAALDIGQNFGLDLTGILSGGCDGLVAQGHHTFNGTQLASQTAKGGVISGNDYSPGSDSPTGCGSNSRYYVDWSVIGAP